MDPNSCNCPLCKPDPERPVRAHPEYGYDLDKVPEVQCLLCGESIGDEPYREDKAVARFGQMFFLHERCAEACGGTPDRVKRRVTRPKPDPVSPETAMKASGMAEAA